MQKLFIVILSLLFTANLLAAEQAKTPSFDEIDEIGKMVDNFLRQKAHDTHTVVKNSVGKAQGKEKHYFVQLGAFSESRPQELIRRLKAAGFDVTFKPVVRGDRRMTLLLAGPFASRSQTDQNLQKLHSFVPDAFICH